MIVRNINRKVENMIMLLKIVLTTTQQENFTYSPNCSGSPEYKPPLLEMKVLINRTSDMSFDSNVKNTVIREAKEEGTFDFLIKI